MRPASHIELHSQSSLQVRELVRRTQIPVVQTLMGLGTFPETHPLALQACPDPDHDVAAISRLHASPQRLHTNVKAFRQCVKLLHAHTAVHSHSSTQQGKLVYHCCPTQSDRHACDADVLPTVQMLGMHGTVVANYAVDCSDLLLAIGMRC